MKFLKLLAVCLLAVLTGLCVTSCSSDNDDSSASSPIIGTWICTNATASPKPEYVMFCKNNIAYGFETSKEHGYDVMKLEYTYNESTSKLVMINIFYKETLHYEILSLTNNKVIVEKDKNTYTFEKTTSPCSEAQLEKLYNEQLAFQIFGQVQSAA